MVTPPQKTKQHDAPSPVEPKRVEFDIFKGGDVPADNKGDSAVAVVGPSASPPSDAGNGVQSIFPSLRFRDQHTSQFSQLCKAELQQMRVRKIQRAVVQMARILPYSQITCGEQIPKKLCCRSFLHWQPNSQSWMRLEIREIAPSNMQVKRCCASPECRLLLSWMRSQSPLL